MKRRQQNNLESRGAHLMCLASNTGLESTGCKGEGELSGFVPRFAQDGVNLLWARGYKERT